MWPGARKAPPSVGLGYVGGLLIRSALLAALVAAFVVPGTANARPGCHSRACSERVARKHCSNRHPHWCVERAILTYRLDGWQASWMRRIPGCESGWDPHAVNGGGSGSLGLYQFMPGTWASTPYGRHSPFSAKWASLAAAWMVRAGRSREWVCV